MVRTSTDPAPVGGRRQAREAALQLIYLADLAEIGPADVPAYAWSEEPLAPRVREFAQRLAQGAISKQDTLDPLIRKHTQNWELNRMASIDRCVLRMAAFELLFEPETPVSVVINEAVEIVKKFSTADSGKFVNGILDKLKEERTAV